MLLKKNNYPMSLIDYVYAHIYTWYQKMVEKGRKVNPQGLTSMVFGICANGWFIFFTEVYFSLFKSHRITINTLVYVIVALIFAGLVNVIYSSKDRYQVVYNKYQQSDKVRERQKAIVISWIFIFFPYLLLLLFLI
jgi:hypothetical protein